MPLIRTLPVALLLCSFGALAQPSQGKEGPEEEPKTPTEVTADKLRHQVTTRVIRLANQIDNFFGERRALDAKNKSTMVVALNQYFPEGGISGPSVDANLNLKLINLENFGKKLENSVLGKEFEKINPPSTHEDPPYGPQPEELPWRLVLDQRVGAKWPPTYSAKLRTSKDFYTGVLFHHFSADYGWDTENLKTTTLNYEFDFDLASDWLFRWINTGTMFFDHNRSISSHGPSFINTLDEKTQMSYNLRLNTEYLDHRLHYISGYSANIVYRRDLYNQWVYLQLEPSVYFPRTYDYKKELNFLVRFEARFGDS